MKLELRFENLPPDALRMGRRYELVPVIEDGDFIGYVVHDARTGAFVTFVTTEQVAMRKDRERP